MKAAYSYLLGVQTVHGFGGRECPSAIVIGGVGGESVSTRKRKDRKRTKPKHSQAGIASGRRDGDEFTWKIKKSLGVRSQETYF